MYCKFMHKSELSSKSPSHVNLSKWVFGNGDVCTALGQELLFIIFALQSVCLYFGCLVKLTRMTYGWGLGLMSYCSLYPLASRHIKKHQRQDESAVFILPDVSVMNVVGKFVLGNGCCQESGDVESTQLKGRWRKSKSTRGKRWFWESMYFP